MRSLLINVLGFAYKQNRRFCFCRGAVYLHEDKVRIKITPTVIAEVQFIFTKHEVLSKDNKLVIAEVQFIFMKHEVLSKDNKLVFTLAMRKKLLTALRDVFSYNRLTRA